MRFLRLVWKIRRSDLRSRRRLPPYQTGGDVEAAWDRE